MPFVNSNLFFSKPHAGGNISSNHIHTESKHTQKTKEQEEEKSKKKQKGNKGAKSLVLFFFGLLCEVSSAEKYELLIQPLCHHIQHHHSLVPDPSIPARPDPDSFPAQNPASIQTNPKRSNPFPYSSPIAHILAPFLSRPSSNPNRAHHM